MSANRLPEPKKPEGRIQAPAQVEYFYPREHAILAEYFEDKKKLPKEARKIDPYEIIPYETEYDESAEGIICREGRGGSDGYQAIRNAVARIALAPIRDGLPVWGTYADGQVRHSRQRDQQGDLPVRGYRSDPVLAVAINWADSGPGCSWPLTYHVAWIPVYDQYVVTVSYDTDDIEGYLDVAIGCLPEGAGVETDLKEVIQGHWERDAYNLQAWSYCINPGIVKDPYAWRDEIHWGIDENGEEISYSDEEEEDWDDEDESDDDEEEDS